MRHRLILTITALCLMACDAPLLHDAEYLQTKASEILPADLLPVAEIPTQEITQHAFMLGYYEKYEMSAWVGYMLCRDRLVYNDSERPLFEEDNNVATKSATFNDYRNSGYDKGHLVPAQDMKWDSVAYIETFLMSNITPQRHDFNCGVWNNLERQVRSWAKRYDTLYIFCGPILDNITEKIGDNEVGVPKQFYKVVYRPSDQEAIAFIIPQNKPNSNVKQWIVSVDDVEAAIHIDLMAGLTNEDEIERHSNPNKWKFHRY